MNRTAIEWTDFTANPLKYRTADGRVVWACEKLSPGCAHCYAKSLADVYTTRRAGDWNAAVMKTLTPFLDEKEQRAMLRYGPAHSKRVFVGDMTDVFGEWVADALLDRLFATLAWRADVTWQVLTKRAARMREYFSGDWHQRVSAEYRAMRARGQASISKDYYKQRLQGWTFASITCGAHEDRFLPNVWLGVSCEDQIRADERIPHLLQTPAAVRFISAEPLLGHIDLSGFVPNKAGWKPYVECRHGFDACPICDSDPQPALDWVIVGGESGGGARRCRVEWIRSLRRQCKRAGVSCFVKQLGAHIITRNDDDFDGHDDDAWPDQIAMEDRVEDRINGFREEYQGADVRVRLRDRKGGDFTEWPPALRVREFPRTTVLV